MTTPAQNPNRHPVRTGFAAVTAIATGALLLTAGVLTLLQGISAVANDDLLVVGPQYTYQLDTTGWGWIHIVLGVVLIAVSLGLFTGTTWARVAAITIAAISIIANFLWLPYYPLWSIAIIAVDLVVIWAVATWNADRV